MVSSFGDETTFYTQLDMIFYHTLAGDFANDWKFECGKVTKTVKPKIGKSIGLELKPASEIASVGIVAMMIL